MHHNRYRLHPWHGISCGENAPAQVTAYIEITPGDTVKYELDKISGILKVDRPQQYSNVVPALYGFIPQTYCGENVASISQSASGENIRNGDGDPIDILILTEHHIVHGDLLVQAIPIGGLLMIDNHEADDKIIAVLCEDSMYGHYTDLFQLPEKVLHRLTHYFLTYKQGPTGKTAVSIPKIYGREDAHHVIHASMKDYQTHFGKNA